MAEELATDGSASMQEMELHKLKKLEHRLENKVDDVKELVKKHIRKDKQYYSVIDDLVAKQEETKMEAIGIPAVLGGNNDAALIAAMMSGRGHDGSGAAGMGLGAGLGGGLLGGILAGALFGNRRGGLLGDEGGAGVSGLNNLQGAIDTNAILSGIGDIKASVPLSEAQMQLALAGATSDITSQNMQQTIALQQQLFNGQLATLGGFNSLGDKVDLMSTQLAVGQGVTNTNIERLGWQLSREGSDNTNKILAQMNAIDQANLNRIITTQAAELAEIRNESRRDSDRHGIEINMINNQNQNQLQFQQQAQALNTLHGGLVDALQNIRATNQAINIGGTQLASPTNTNTNVKA